MPCHCVFCGSVPVVEGRIFPHWLDFMIPASEEACLDAKVVSALGADAVDEGHGKRQPLSRTPRLACANCNDGWIAAMHEKVRPFLIPAVRGDGVVLTPEQVKLLSGWLCLLAFNVAFLTHHCGISAGDRTHLRHTGEPPKNWSIFAAALREPGWSGACRHNPYRIEFAGNPMTTHSKERPIQDCNTQLLSFGMGSMFFHMFSSPSLMLLNDFNAASRNVGLVPLWPPARRFGVLPQRGVKLPLEVKLTDAQAGRIADDFAEGLRCRVSAHTLAQTPAPSAAPTSVGAAA
jgi:hypothetical protein